jgi:hypothetical protein
MDHHYRDRDRQGIADPGSIRQKSTDRVTARFAHRSVRVSSA